MLEENILIGCSVLTEFAPEDWAAVHSTVLTNSICAP